MTFRPVSILRNALNTDAAFPLKVRVPVTSRFGDSHGCVVKTLAIAKTADLRNDQKD